MSFTVCIGASSLAAAYAALSDSKLPAAVDRLGFVFSLPIPAVAVLIAIVGLLPAILRDWRIGFWAFAAWLPFEDLVRKFAGNDVRVYVMKDLIFLVLLASLAKRLIALRAWKDASGEARAVTLALVSWATALAAYAAIDDWRVGLLGLRLNFFYLPLVAVGYFVAKDATRLRRVLFWLTIIATTTVILGIIQFVVGPSFLRPTANTPGLVNLENYRGFFNAAGSASQVFRPSGTFADPGRFASMALVSLVLSLATLGVHSGQARADRAGRWVSSVGIVISLIGVYVAGGRAPLIIGLVIAVVSFVGPKAEGRSRARRIVAMGAAAAVAGLTIAVVAPTQASEQVSFYAQSLNPQSDRNEWDLRWNNYAGSLARGVAIAPLFGRGAGTHSVGLQYIYGGESNDVKALSRRYGDASTGIGYEVESGWGAVAIEYGKVGVVLWTIWSLVWMRRILSSYRSVRAHREGRAVLPMAVWTFMLLFVLFFTGYQSFQNYLSNAYFWLLSGIIFGVAIPPRESTPQQTAEGQVQLVG